METLIDTIATFFKKSSEELQGETPEGICPNCWGTQEYDTTIRNLYKDHQINVNNRESNYAFIQKFVVDKMDGIVLKKGNNGMICPTCIAKA